MVDTLLDTDHEVIVIDNMTTGSLGNLSKWKSHPHLILYQEDIILSVCLTLSRRFIYQAPSFRVDYVYHLACPASPVHYQKDPVQTMKTNVLGTLNICALATEWGARLLLASTSEVYGDPAIHPQVEEYTGNVDPTGPRSCYDEGKRAAETICMDFHRRNGLEVRIARIFNTYGPRMALDDGRVVSNFIVQSLQGQSLSLYGDGSQTRSFCYVSDLVRGLVALMHSNYTGPVNLGNPEEFTVQQLGEQVSSIVLNKSDAVQFEYRSLPKDDPTRRRPDISKAKTILEWEPRVTLQEGLQLTIPDFQARLNDPVQISHQRDATLL